MCQGLIVRRPLMLRLVIEVSAPTPHLDLDQGDLVVIELVEGVGLEVSVTRDRPAGFIHSLLPLADSPVLRVLSSSPPSLPLYLRELARLADVQPLPGRRLRVLR